VFRRSQVPKKKLIVNGIMMKPAMPASAPAGPRSRDPTQTAIPTMFGPGMNWQRLSTSAKSSSPSQRRCSTTRRRAKTMPPPPPTLNNATFKKPRNSAGNEALSPQLPSSSAHIISHLAIHAMPALWHARRFKSRVFPERAYATLSAFAADDLHHNILRPASSRFRRPARDRPVALNGSCPRAATPWRARRAPPGCGRRRVPAR
jgi:hypothetical protein